MPLRQQFSTTIYSWDAEMSAEVLFLPRAGMTVPETDDAQYFRSVVDTLDLGVALPVHARNLGLGLAVFLAAADDDNQAILRAHTKERSSIGLDGSEFLAILSSEYVDCSKELLTSSRIPIEESPLSGVSLEELFSKAAKTSPIGLGALIGWMIAGSSPMLLLWVPTGIIIIQSAVGIAKGLEEGLHARIKRLFTPQEKTRRKK